MYEIKTPVSKYTLDTAVVVEFKCFLTYFFDRLVNCDSICPMSDETVQNAKNVSFQMKMSLDFR